MKTFMFLFKGDADWLNLSPEETQRLVEQWSAWVGELMRTGHVESGMPLDAGGTLVSSPTTITTEAPFAESWEAVSGCLLISADDLDEAVEIAKVCPILAVGGQVEGRAVQERTS